MATLTIRNLDDHIVDILRSSLEAEARQILTDTAKPPAAADFRSLAERIAMMTPEVQQTDSADLLRQDRRR